MTASISVSMAQLPALFDDAIALHSCPDSQQADDVMFRLASTLVQQVGCPVGIGSARASLMHKVHALVHAT
eukprot:9183828-Prorocentrum_lima.AAC.1